MQRSQYIMTYEQLAKLGQIEGMVLAVVDNPKLRRLEIHVGGEGEWTPDGMEAPLLGVDNFRRSKD